MQFITNRIYTGGGKTFEDYVKECSQKAETVKTASTEDEKVVKKAEQEEADSSGQLDVEPLEQEGESRTMPKDGPKAKKESKEAKVTDNENKSDADSSGQPEWEGKKENNNDPEKPTEKGGSSEEEVKEAGQVCDTCGKSCDECECETKTKPCKAEDSDKDVKEAGNLPEALEEHKFKKKDEKEEKEGDSKKEEKEEKEATSKQFVKVANLDAKNKAFLRKYWSQLFGDEYVNALLADK